MNIQQMMRREKRYYMRMARIASCDATRYRYVQQALAFRRLQRVA